MRVQVPSAWLSVSSTDLRLSAVVGADPTVSDICVSKRLLRVRRCGWPFITYVLPSYAVSRFIEGFDSGAYPLLVEQQSARIANTGPHAGSSM